MREPNYSALSQNRAAAVITSSLYDRRALDCTATLPLVNSLTHLTYMTSTSPRIREILVTDGGLERLIRILASPHKTDRHSLWKWSLAFQCLVNVGVRGTETIRTRVVEAGAVHVVLAILENFQAAFGRANISNRQHKMADHCFDGLLTSWQPPSQSQSPSFHGTQPVLLGNTSTSATPMDPHAASAPVQRRCTFLAHTRRTKTKPSTSNGHPVPLLNTLSTEAILHREDDIVLSLQLLAYLSKYPHIRLAFHTGHRANVFSVVERFTRREHPPPIVYWAGVIMRNACRKDESKGGIRQCAYIHCGKWETFPHEFAKCRRCRKAKYCSKACQSNAWQEGHRWWCMERPHSNQPPNTTSSTTTVAAAAAIVAAEPIPDQTVGQVVPIDPAVTTETMPISIDQNTMRSSDHETDDRNRRTHVAETSTDIRTPSEGTTHTRQASPLLFYRQHQRNSRSVRRLTSGSSTEVDTDVAGTHDLMEVD